MSNKKTIEKSLKSLILDDNRDTINSICDALVSLRDEHDEYAWKVNQRLKSANINLEDYQ